MKNARSVSRIAAEHSGAAFLPDVLSTLDATTRPLAHRPLLDRNRGDRTRHPPAWTLVLAGPSALGLRSYLSHQLVACLVGTATIVMTGSPAVPHSANELV